MSEWEEHVALVLFQRAVRGHRVCLDYWDVEPNHRKWWMAETNGPWPHRIGWEVYTVVGTSVHGPLWSGGLESGGCERRMVYDSEGMEYGSYDPLNNDPLNNDHSDPIDEISVCKIVEDILGSDSISSVGCVP